MKTVYLQTLFFAAALAMVSCYRKPRQKGTFILSGRLVDPCSGRPIVGQYLQVNLRVSPDYTPNSSNYADIGHDSTDVDGTFVINCDYYRTALAKRYLLSTSSGSDYSSGDILSFDDEAEVSDLGTYFSPRYQATYTRIVRRPHSATDTLYIGSTFDGWGFVSPIIDSQFVKWLRPFGLSKSYVATQGGAPYHLSWGIGRAQFDSACADLLRQPQRFTLEAWCDTVSRPVTVVLE